MGEGPFAHAHIRLLCIKEEVGVSPDSTDRISPVDSLKSSRFRV